MIRENNGCVDFYGVKFPVKETRRPRKLHVLRTEKGKKRGELIRYGRHFRKIALALPFGLYIVRDYCVNDALF